MLVNQLLVGVPVRNLWNPNYLSGMALWLDAADINTIQLNGGNVVQWNDKSGNGRNAVQGLASRQPNYTNKTLLFDGIDDRLSISIGNSFFADTFYIFQVYKPTKVSGDVNIFLSNRSSTINGFTIHKSLVGGYDTWITSGNSIFFNLNQVAGSTDIIYYQRSASNRSVYKNGSLVVNFGNAGILSDINAGDTLHLGGETVSGVQYTFQGTHNEILIINSSLSESDCQKVEGYLAHKWNLSANLPATHPYRFFPLVV